MATARTSPAETRLTRHRPGKWLSWLLGLAFLGGVILAVKHFSEGQEFVRLARGAEPSWLIGALVLQAATYLAQGEIWRIVGRRAGRHLPRVMVYKLALAKLFVDQALPTAGVSGTVVVAQLLKEKELPRSAVLAGIVINTTSFFIAYFICLAAALSVLFFSHHLSSVILISSLLFMLLSIALAAGMLALVGKDIGSRLKALARRRIVHNALDVMKDASPRLVRDWRIQATTTGCQVLTFLLDAATLWFLIRSLGASAHPSHVFATFMFANLVRTVSFVPGGLGTFEAAAVLMLRIDGISVAAALSAALLFRGLTFFLPMIPGLWFSRPTKLKKSVSK